MTAAPRPIRVLVTGATGFVGAAVLRALAAAGIAAVALHRRGQTPATPAVQWHHITALTDLHAAHPAWHGVDAVIHLAGQAHARAPEAVFAADAAATAALARVAAMAGVRRFVFVSTAKVYGEVGTFVTDAPPAPLGAYARYKLAAEAAVWAAAGGRDSAGAAVTAASTLGIGAAAMTATVVRPVLVTGAGARGNLAVLARWIAAGRPLPLGGITNRRSLVDVDDLAALLVACTYAPAAAGATLVAAAPQTLSTTKICQALAAGIGRPARLFALPPLAWRALAAFAPSSGLAMRLSGSFTVDAASTTAVLGWMPRVDPYDSLVALGRGVVAAPNQR